MEIRASDGVSLFVRRLDGQRTPIVLCHSLASSSEDLRPLAEVLAERGHRVVWFDQRGHGRSTELGTVTLARLAEDVVEVIVQTDSRGAIAIGHSSGGYALLALGDRAASVLSQIVAVGTTPQLSAPGEKLTMRYAASPAMVRLQQRRGTGLPLVRTGAFGARPDPELVEQVWRSAAACPSATRKAFVEAMLAENDLTRIVPKVDVPIVAVRGTRDRVVSRRRGRQLADLAAHGTYVEVVGGGHMVPVERPAAIADVLALGDASGRRDEA